MTEGRRRNTVYVKFLVVLVAIMSIQALAKLSQEDQELLDTAWNIKPEQVKGMCSFTQATRKQEDVKKPQILEEIVGFDPRR